MTLLLALALQAAAPTPANPCPADYQALLALDYQAFDQDMTGGWRALSQRPGCETVAADLIRVYRMNIESHISILYWHEAQLRANAGQSDQAIALMERSRKEEDGFGWNLYVDASIAFLRGDRAALVAARERLAALPRPADFREQELPNGFRLTWPMNLAVVDALVRCFGRPYREAYGSAECRAVSAPAGN